MQGDSPNSIANRAVLMMGDDTPPIVGTLPNFDSSAAGQAAAKLYTPCVQTVARQYGFDFGRNLVVLALTGNTPLDSLWKFEYAYPANGVEIRQLLPPSLDDPNDPHQVDWTVGNVLVGGVPTKVIWSGQAGAIASFTNQPPEGLWDAGFTESVVRLLSSEMAMALAGRPGTAAALLETARDFEQASEMRDG